MLYRLATRSIWAVSQWVRVQMSPKRVVGDTMVQRSWYINICPSFFFVCTSFPFKNSDSSHYGNEQFISDQYRRNSTRDSYNAGSYKLDQYRWNNFYLIVSKIILLLLCKLNYWYLIYTIILVEYMYRVRLSYRPTAFPCFQEILFLAGAKQST